MLVTVMEMLTMMDEGEGNCDGGDGGVGGDGYGDG